MDGGQRLLKDDESRKRKQPTQAARANADEDTCPADEDVASAGRAPRDHAAGSLAPRRSRVRRGLHRAGGTTQERREGERGVTSGGGPAWISRAAAAGSVPSPGCAEFGTGGVEQSIAITSERREVPAAPAALASPAMGLEVQKVRPTEKPGQTGTVYLLATTGPPTVVAPRPKRAETAAREQGPLVRPVPHCQIHTMQIIPCNA